MSKLPPIVAFRICTGFSMAVDQMRGYGVIFFKTWFTDFFF